MNLHPAPRTDKEGSSNGNNEMNLRFVQFDQLDDKENRSERCENIASEQIFLAIGGSPSELHCWKVIKLRK